jgi:hypothetical protein
MTTKAEEATSSVQKQEDAPPTYTPDTSDPAPYDAVVAHVRAELDALSTGDPAEQVSVPMISRMHHKSIHDLNPFSKKTGKITQTVRIRKMTREMYLKHYVKDAEGNFVGSANPAPDAALVFVLSKSTPEDLTRQVQEVAFNRQQIRGGGIGKYGQPNLPVAADSMPGTSAPF